MADPIIVDFEQHLAELAFHHGVEFDAQDLAVFAQAAREGADPHVMEQFVDRYVADVYESDGDDVDVELGDSGSEFVDDEPDDQPTIPAPVSAFEDHIGRRLTGSERERLAGQLDGQRWTGNVEEVAAAAGLKPFEDMSTDEHTAWMAARVGELNPPPDLEVPVNADGGVDYDSMSSDQINQYMADRASGIEYEDVTGD
jgi:hypothetical protein